MINKGKINLSEFVSTAAYYTKFKYVIVKNLLAFGFQKITNNTCATEGVKYCLKFKVFDVILYSVYYFGFAALISGSRELMN